MRDKRSPLHAVKTALLTIALSSSLTMLATPAFAQETGLPLMAQGIQIGDLTQGRALIWSRADRPSRMMVQYAFNPEFTDSVTVRGPHALPENDFTTKQDLTGLPDGVDVYVKVWYQDLTAEQNQSEPVIGRFSTIGNKDNIRFVWGGDIAGQGWGINDNFGGMKIFETMRRLQPNFFLLSGDSIYADSPIQETVVAENGQIWVNRVTPETSKVAETLKEFRGRYQYNLLDDNVRRFNAEVPQIWTWDDHEVVNNWSPSKDLTNDNRYTVKDVPLLVARAGQAFREYAPLRPNDAEELERIYRKVSFGKLLDVFVIDIRSYRGPNTNNLQSAENSETIVLGEQQLKWLQQALKESKATWKVISASAPIGLNISDDFPNNPPQRWEGIANGNDGSAVGRELEFARLFKFIKQKRIENVVWFTADVHYVAAHFYDPSQAATQDFLPFWEFVAGPLNAGSFGPNSTDGTFGPQVVFSKAPPPGQANLSPLAGLQFFGEANIDRRTKAMTVEFKDINGDVVFSQVLSAIDDKSDDDHDDDDQKRKDKNDDQGKGRGKDKKRD